MAFGDLVGTVKSEYDASTASHRLTLDASPVEDNLIVACHFTGATDSQAMTGMTEAKALSDGVNNDQVAIYYRVVQAADGTSWGADAGAADESCLVLFQIEGPFAASPLDVTASDGPNTTPQDPQSSGTTASTTQADELAVAICSARDGGGTEINPPSWSNSFTAAGDAGNYQTKAAAASYKVLTATGTVTTAADWNETPDDDTMGIIATFKKEAAAGSAIPIILQHME